ncbi:FecR family protein [Microscilla marina]|uniref:Putative anti-sigma factor n=1 Tax=Microscilla marina ATCC 23134 TaxID=313606 RepID=A1ZZ36_MICM2|nr:FecR domain-containing protein [Microscilla marina]EAY24358.1 putative anti-sigma factor [Microscilla marina ATCC 23134]
MQNWDLLLAKYFAGEANHQEERQVLHWMQANPQEADKLKAVWKSTQSKQGFASDVHFAWQQVQRRINSTNNVTKLKRKAVSWVAAAVLVLGLGVVWWSLSQKKQTWQIAKTLTKKLDSLTLADGSKVWLHHTTQLRYPTTFGKSQRVVHLQGEAYFEIAKNPAKPFIIYSGNTITQVLGTSFNLKARPEEQKVEVSVNSGKVAFFDVAKPDKKVLLTQGNQGRFEAGKLKKIKAYHPNLFAWKTGVLSFEQAKLSTIVQTLTTHYGTPIRLANPQLGRCTLTTQLERLPLHEALEIIALTLHLQYQINDKEVLLSGKPCP